MFFFLETLFNLFNNSLKTYFTFVCVFYHEEHSEEIQIRCHFNQEVCICWKYSQQICMQPFAYDQITAINRLSNNKL